MKTAMKTRVEVMSAVVTSCMAARVFPCFACTASATTMASSTTVPITSTRAKSVSVFSEKSAM